MNEPRELHECGRCLIRDHTVRLHWVNREREARLDRRLLVGPAFDVEYRCRACREAVRPQRENRP